MVLTCRAETTCFWQVLNFWSLHLRQFSTRLARKNTACSRIVSNTPEVDYCSDFLTKISAEFMTLPIGTCRTPLSTHTVFPLRSQGSSSAAQSHDTVFRSISQCVWPTAVFMFNPTFFDLSAAIQYVFHCISETFAVWQKILSKNKKDRKGRKWVRPSMEPRVPTMQYAT